jgi:Pathogenicity locus
MPTPSTIRDKRPKDLQTIPGVGPAIADKLLGLGISRVTDLCERDAEDLYAELCTQAGQHVDRCVLYVFRCAIWFAQHDAGEHQRHPEKLKWWHWKDPA